MSNLYLTTNFDGEFVDENKCFEFGSVHLHFKGLQL